MVYPNSLIVTGASIFRPLASTITKSETPLKWRGTKMVVTPLTGFGNAWTGVF